MSKQTTPPERFSASWLQSLDGRTAVAQEMQARWQELTTDLGGVDRLSYQQKSLASRALWLEYWMQQQEQALAAGQEFDVGKWTQAANSLQGILSKLGLVRRPREVQDLQAFMASRGIKA